MADDQAIIDRIATLEQNIRADLKDMEERRRTDIQGIYDRLNDEAKLGHEVRLQAIEKRLDGFWAKVTGLIGTALAAAGTLYHLVRGE